MEGDIAAPTDVNNDNKFEILNTSSQPNVSITRSSNNRSNPDNPDTLPAQLHVHYWRMLIHNTVRQGLASYLSRSTFYNFYILYKQLVHSHITNYQYLVISTTCMYVYGSHTLYNVESYMLTSLEFNWQLIAMILVIYHWLLVIESEFHL
jgi:hypothetical protein